MEALRASIIFIPFNRNEFAFGEFISYGKAINIKQIISYGKAINIIKIISYGKAINIELIIYGKAINMKINLIMFTMLII